MFFYEYFVLFVFSVIGTIVGFIIVFAFLLPLGIFKEWLMPSKPKVEVKEVRRH